MRPKLNSSSTEVGDHLHPVENIFQIHLEGGDAGRVTPPEHVADVVATPLQRKHPAAEPTDNQIGSNDPLTDQHDDPRHLVVQIGVTLTRFLRPVVLARRRQREFRQIQQIPIFIWGSGNVEEPHLPIFDRLRGRRMRIEASSVHVDDNGTALGHHLGLH